MARNKKPKTLQIPLIITRMQMLVEMPEAFSKDEAGKIIADAAQALEQMMHRRYLASRALDWQDPVAADGELVSREIFLRIPE